MLPADGPGCQHGHHDRHTCAQNADHLNHNTRFSPFFTEVVCTLGTTAPQTATSPPPNGGNGAIRTTTRRRHADRQPLVLQNPPTAVGMESAGGAGGPGRGASGRRSRTTSRSADRSSRRGRLAGRPRRSPAPRPGPVPRKPAGPQATTSATQQHVVSYDLLLQHNANQKEAARD